MSVSFIRNQDFMKSTKTKIYLNRFPNVLFAHPLPILKEQLFINFSKLVLKTLIKTTSKFVLFSSESILLQLSPELDTTVSATIELIFSNFDAKHHQTHGANFDNINVIYCIFLRTVSIAKKQCCLA